MNLYEMTQAAKKDRLREKAASLREQAAEIEAANPMTIQPGSGHLPTRKQCRAIRKNLEAAGMRSRANYCEMQADKVGSGGISSDDPDAITKLGLKGREDYLKARAMRQANGIMRDYPPHLWQVELEKLGLDPEEIHLAINPPNGRKPGFPRESIQAREASVRRIIRRISELRKEAGRPTVEVEGDGYTLREDREENRIMFIFPGKPGEEVREMLKHHGFKWSPRRSAWVRMLNENGRRHAGYVREKLAEMLWEGHDA